MIERNYTTRDLYEASLLYAKHSEYFVGLEQDGRDILFVFEDEPCRSTASTYYARRCEVGAKDYSDAIRTCKDLIFNRLREARL